MLQKVEIRTEKKYIVETCSKLGVLLSGLYVELFRGTNSIKWYLAWGMQKFEITRL